jgi:RNA recognition motif-containing protein
VFTYKLFLIFLQNPPYFFLNIIMNTTTIFVDNISASTTVFDLEIIFRAHGCVKRVHIPSDRKTGANRGIAFVTMASSTEAEQAIFCMQGYRSDYMIWNLSWAKTKQQPIKKKGSQQKMKQKRKPDTKTKQEIHQRNKKATKSQRANNKDGLSKRRSE